MVTHGNGAKQNKYVAGKIRDARLGSSPKHSVA